MKIHWLILFCFIATICRADDLALNLAAGKQVGELVQFEDTAYPHVFRDYKVLKREPDGIRISHSTGFSKIPYELLPEELTKDQPFDPVAAKAYRDEQKAAKLKAAHAMQQETAKVNEAKKVASETKKAEAATKSVAASEEAKKAAWIQMQKCEDLVAREINTRTNRKIIKDPSVYRGTTESVAYVRRNGGWWPGNPIEDPDARFSFAAKDAVEQWYKLKAEFGF